MHHYSFHVGAAQAGIHFPFNAHQQRVGGRVRGYHVTSLARLKREMSVPPARRSRGAGSVELERQVEGSEGAGSVLSYNPHMNLTLTQQRQRLPIFKVSLFYPLSACGVCDGLSLNVSICSTEVKFYIWWRSTGLWLSLERLALGRLHR